MKIVQLNLLAFGPFTDHTLDLDASGLHLVYGPNEAGKSSALRALRAFLFGIPNNSSDNFVHPNSSLRIGATLQPLTGQVVTLLRRKGLKNTLLKADGKTAQDEQLLQRLLGGASQTVFDSIFGLDHAELVAGGRSIIQGTGDLAQVLFSAGTGIPDLEKIQKSLESEAEALFKNRGSKQIINGLISEADDLRKKIKEAQIPSSQWVERRDQVQAATAKIEQLDQQRSSHSAERNRLQRFQNALPLIARYLNAQSLLAELGTVVLLPGDFAERRRKAANSLEIAQHQHQQIEQRVAAWLQQLDQLEVDASLVPLADQADQLQKDLGSYIKAQGDLPGLELAVQQHRHHAGELLPKIRPDLTYQQLDELRISEASERRINQLGKQYSGLHQALVTVGDEQETLDIQLRNLKQQLATQTSFLVPTHFAQVIERWREAGPLDQQWANYQLEVAAQQEQLEIDLQRLPHWSDAGFEALERLQIPTEETVQQFEEDFALLAQQLKEQSQQSLDYQDRQHWLHQQVEQLQHEGAIVTEADLNRSREHREELWQSLKLPFISGAPLAEPGVSGLCASYEQAVQQADTIADRLRREAERVSQLSQHTAELSTIASRLEVLAGEQQQASAEQAKLNDRWQALWTPLDVTPGSPKEMQAWLKRQQKLCEQGGQLRLTRKQSESLAEQIEQGRQELLQGLRHLPADALQVCGVDPSHLAASVGLGALLSSCREVVAKLQKLYQEYQEQQTRLFELTTRQEQSKLDVEKAQQKLSAWRTAWREAIAAISADEDLLPDEVDVVMSLLRSLFKAADEAASLEARVQEIKRDEAAFQQRVDEILGRVAPDLVGQPLESGVHALIARIRSMSQNEQKRQELQKSLQSDQARLEATSQTLLQAQAELSTLCQEAGGAEIEQLPEMERISLEATALKTQVQDLQQQLLQLSAGENLAGFIEQAETHSVDQLAVRLTQLDEQINTLSQQRDEHIRLRSVEQHELDKINGSSTAADYAEQLQQVLSKIEDEVQQYVRLRLARSILNEAVVRYREQNEGPVLKRASELFARLTLGAFEGIRADFNDKGDSQLVAVRPGSNQVFEVQHLSEGTADQLYLAIRLAALESYLATASEPLPLIVDDVLVNFDDERSQAALKVFAEIASKTQVLFFTHHQHLLDLAADCLPSRAYERHRLQRRSLTQNLPVTSAL